jgi:hypothetical protein
MVPSFVLKRINMSSLQQPDKGGGIRSRKMHTAPSTIINAVI